MHREPAGTPETPHTIGVNEQGLIDRVPLDPATANGSAAEQPAPPHRFSPEGTAAAARAQADALTSADNARGRIEAIESDREVVTPQSFRVGGEVWVLRKSTRVMDTAGWTVVGPDPVHEGYVKVSAPDPERAGGMLDKTVPARDLAEWQPRFHPGTVVPQVPTRSGFEPFEVFHVTPAAVTLSSARVGSTLDDAIATRTFTPAELFRLQHEPQTTPEPAAVRTGLRDRLPRILGGRRG